MDISVFQRDVSDLAAALKQGLEAQIFGSFSERNPGLGRMITCPHCHTRRRQFATEKCCNASHATTMRAWSASHDKKGERLDKRPEKGFGPTTRHEKGFYQEACAPRVVEAPMAKWFFKKFRHKRHGQSRAWKIRQMTQRMQMDFHFLEFAAESMHTTTPKPEHIPAFAEKYYHWQAAQIVKRQRKQQDISRRVNLGLLPGLDG
jgi:hypothetical protein